MTCAGTTSPQQKVPAPPPRCAGQAETSAGASAAEATPSRGPKRACTSVGLWRCGLCMVVHCLLATRSPLVSCAAEGCRREATARGSKRADARSMRAASRSLICVGSHVCAEYGQIAPMFQVFGRARVAVRLSQCAYLLHMTSNIACAGQCAWLVIAQCSLCSVCGL
jgi:hypothetical protein